MRHDAHLAFLLPRVSLLDRKHSRTRLLPHVADLSRCRPARCQPGNASMLAHDTSPARKDASSARRKVACLSTADLEGVRRGPIPHRISPVGPQRSEEPGASAACCAAEAARRPCAKPGCRPLRQTSSPARLLRPTRWCCWRGEMRWCGLQTPGPQKEKRKGLTPNVVVNGRSGHGPLRRRRL